MLLHRVQLGIVGSIVAATRLRPAQGGQDHHQGELEGDTTRDGPTEDGLHLQDVTASLPEPVPGSYQTHPVPHDLSQILEDRPGHHR